MDVSSIYILIDVEPFTRLYLLNYDFVLEYFTLYLIAAHFLNTFFCLVFVMHPMAICGLSLTKRVQLAHCFFFQSTSWDANFGL